MLNLYLYGRGGICTYLAQNQTFRATNNFNLRNGGQHGISNRMDAVMSRLAEGSNIDRMALSHALFTSNGATGAFMD